MSLKFRYPPGLVLGHLVILEESLDECGYQRSVYLTNRAFPDKNIRKFIVWFIENRLHVWVNLPGRRRFPPCDKSAAVFHFFYVLQ